MVDITGKKRLVNMLETIDLDLENVWENVKKTRLSFRINVTLCTE